MKIDALEELEQEVVKAVAAVDASAERKRSIEAELLAHVRAIYDEELERRGQQELAVRATKRRFGSAAALIDSLQDSVPYLERTFFHCFSRREILMTRGVWFAVVAAVLVVWALVFPEQAQVIAGALAMLCGVAIVRFCQTDLAFARWLRAKRFWLTGIPAIFIGPAIILPALAAYRDLGVPAERAVPPMILGAAIVLAGIVAIVYGVASRRSLISQ